MDLAFKECAIQLPIDERYFHGGMAVHGSVYFKLLDDAAYFACQSIVTDFFLVTKQFDIQLTRPIVGGTIKAHGKLVTETDSGFIGSAELMDESGKRCGIGKGEFVRSRTALEAISAYSA